MPEDEPGPKDGAWAEGATAEELEAAEDDTADDRALEAYR